MKKGLRNFFDFVERKQDWIVHFAVFFFLVAGMGYSFYLGDTLIYPDAKRYFAIADHVAAGNGYSLDGITPTAYLVPGYPLFLAFFIKLGASITILRYLNFIILALCVYVIRSILTACNAKSGAPVSALLLVGYGVLFYTAGTLYTQTLFTLVLLCIVRLALVPYFRYRHAVLLGILSSIIILIHPTGVFIPPLVVIWLFFPSHTDVIGKGAVAALVAVLCLAPWGYRNYVTFDRFIPISSHGADTLYIGNNPDYKISAWYDYTKHAAYKEANLLPVEEQNRYYLHKIVQFWKEQPGDAVKLYLLKLIDYFNYHNNLHTSSESSGAKDVIMFITYYPLLLCFVLRLLLAGKIPLSRSETLLIALYLTSAFFHALFIPRIRFRLPYDAVLIAYVGIMFSLIGNHFASKQRKKVGTSMGREYFQVTTPTNHDRNS